VSVLEIPTESPAESWTQETALDGRTYRLTFRWNTREGYWYLHIADTDDLMIASSLKLVPGALLLRHCVDYGRRPPGEIIVLGTPNRDTLQNGGFVFYNEAT
jgi:hypothetical protein